MSHFIERLTFDADDQIVPWATAMEEAGDLIVRSLQSVEPLVKLDFLLSGTQLTVLLYEGIAEVGLFTYISYADEGVDEKVRRFLMDRDEIELVLTDELEFVEEMPLKAASVDELVVVVNEALAAHLLRAAPILVAYKYVVCRSLSPDPFGSFNRRPRRPTKRELERWWKTGYERGQVQIDRR